eukprot:2080140-Amphidinium_carterae.1
MQDVFKLQQTHANRGQRREVLESMKRRKMRELNPWQSGTFLQQTLHESAMDVTTAMGAEHIAGVTFSVEEALC